MELKTLMMAGLPSISAFPEGDNMFHWAASIDGVNGTVYEGYTYKLSMKFHNNYPFVAPTIKFESPIFHPNVDQHGNICLDILNEAWSCNYDVKSVLLSLQSLLGDPNNASPLNTQASTLWASQEKYREKVVQFHKD